MMTIERDASDSHRLTHGHCDRNRDGYYNHLYHRLYEAVLRPRANRRRKGYEVGGEFQGEESNDVDSVVWGKGRQLIEIGRVLNPADLHQLEGYSK
jgi:hypothetical protein